MFRGFLFYTLLTDYQPTLLVVSITIAIIEKFTMQKESEVIVFGAIPFVIDREKRELRQFNRPENIIRFNVLSANEGYYSGRFSKDNSYLSVAQLNLDQSNDEQPAIHIPAPIIDSKEALTADLRNDLSILSNKEEWGFHILDQGIAHRLLGVLPHIDLAGTDYTIDWRLKQLRETAEPWNSISLRDMEMSDSCEEYLCFYNTMIHELFEPDEDLFEMPENIVVLEIPYEIKLDPIAVAREYGIGETDLLINHPFQMNLAASVKPLTQSGLSEFIANNIKIKDEQDNSNNTNNRGR